MKVAFRVLALVCAVVLPVLITGCSSKLTRKEVQQEVDKIKRIQLQEKVAQFHLQTAPPELVREEPNIPGFKIADEDFPPRDLYFPIGEQTRSDLNHLVEPLLRLGYLSVKESESGNSHSKIVSFSDKAGRHETYSFGNSYSSGFLCYPAPDFHQCDLPFLLDRETDWTRYKITGIVQDQTHAKVDILIPWKLSAFAIELRPYAAELKGRPDYDTYPNFYGWAHYLNEHGTSGESAATILFQKFDDGWRIVDKDGNSLKEYLTKKS